MAGLQQIREQWEKEVCQVVGPIYRETTAEELADLQRRMIQVCIEVLKEIPTHIQAKGFPSLDREALPFRVEAVSRLEALQEERG